MIPFFALVLINWVAHFIPFERASLSLDDLARLNSTEWSLRFFTAEMRNSLDYPLIIFHNLIVMAAGRDPFLRVLFVFISSSLVTGMVYFVFKELLEDRRPAFLGALFYNLIPNKLALYHTLEYTYIHLALTLYLLSFFLFIRFLKKERPVLLWGALACYSVALFWYLIGFFLPVVFVVYALLVHPRKARAAAVFFIPAAAFVLWRSNLLGFADLETRAYQIQFHQAIPNLFRMVPNLYIGRQMVKGILYGLYRFPLIPLPWQPLLAAADVAILYGLWRWLNKSLLPPLQAKMIQLSLAMLILLLAPALLTVVLDRHTCLSSTGFAFLLLWGISRWRMFQRTILVALIGTGLAISQGTAWNQVVACRINRAIFETLQERKQEILEADRVLIDQYSFSRQIPYTWVKDPNNQMDTYWGVQALLGRGNPFLVHWAVGKKKEVEVVRSSCQVFEKEILFQVYNPDTYTLKGTSVPLEGSVLIDYEAVYHDGFRNGNRVGSQR